MQSPFDLYYDVYRKALSDATKLEIETDDATTAMKNLKTLSESIPPVPPPMPEDKPEPTTVLGKMKAGVGGMWDNETTRVVIKAGGAFAGVALVTWATVRRDHVMTREALSQANQRIS